MEHVWKVTLWPKYRQWGFFFNSDEAARSYVEYEWKERCNRVGHPEYLDKMLYVYNDNIVDTKVQSDIVRVTDEDGDDFAIIMKFPIYAQHPYGDE